MLLYRNNMIVLCPGVKVKGMAQDWKFYAWRGRGSETTERGVGVGGAYPPAHGVETFEK